MLAGGMAVGYSVCGGLRFVLFSGELGLDWLSSSLLLMSSLRLSSSIVSFGLVYIMCRVFAVF